MYEDTLIGICFKLISAGSDAAKLLKLHLPPGKFPRFSGRHKEQNLLDLSAEAEDILLGTGRH
jgi:hypothetical protein